jgi:hypothetical protein
MATDAVPLQTANKLWGDAIWPGQKLRVKRMTEERRARTQSTASEQPPAAPSQRTSLHSGQHTAPLLHRLRALFDEADLLYAHKHVAKTPTRSKLKVCEKSRLSLLL